MSNPANSVSEERSEPIARRSVRPTSEWRSWAAAVSVAVLVGCLLFAAVGKTLSHWQPRHGDEPSLLSSVTIPVDIGFALGILVWRRATWFRWSTGVYATAIVAYRIWWYLRHAVVPRCGCFGDLLTVSQEYVVAGVMLAALGVLLSLPGRP